MAIFDQTKRLATEAYKKSGEAFDEEMVGARGVEPLTSTASKASRGNAPFPLCFLFLTLVTVFGDSVPLPFLDDSLSFRVSTSQKLHTKKHSFPLTPARPLFRDRGMGVNDHPFQTYT